jgi:SapC
MKEHQLGERGMSSNKNNKKLSASAEDMANDQQSMPVFFRNPHALDSVRHAKASVRQSDFAFAEKTNSVPIVMKEFFDIARHYPIVFSLGDTPTALAVLGLEQTNYFVTPEHAWRPDHYIPAYVRQYPFVFLEQPGEERLYLTIDEGAPQFSDHLQNDGSALFTGDGKPTFVTENALKFCSMLYAQHKETREFGLWLKSHELLMPGQSDAKFVSGKTLKLEGFQIINEKAFSEVPEKAVLELRDKHWFAPTCFALAATSNWQRLLNLAESKSNPAA